MLQLQLLLCWHGSVMSASRYVMSTSHYQNRFSMYIRGLIPRNSTEVAKAVPIDSYHQWLIMIYNMMESILASPSPQSSPGRPVSNEEPE